MRRRLRHSANAACEAGISQFKILICLKFWPEIAYLPVHIFYTFFHPERCHLAAVPERGDISGTPPRHKVSFMVSVPSGSRFIHSFPSLGDRFAVSQPSENHLFTYIHFLRCRRQRSRSSASPGLLFSYRFPLV